MTFEDLLHACSKGEMPNVSNGQIKGKVTTIKKNREYFGCAVSFENGPDYDIWFHAMSDNDHRKNYMRDLKLID